MSDWTLSYLTPKRLSSLFRERRWLDKGRIEKVTVEETFSGHADLIARLKLSFISQTRVQLPETVICKLLGPTWYNGAGQAEAFFYRSIAPKTRILPAPMFYGCFDDHEQEVMILFQNSLFWFRKTMETAQVWECEALLT
ncbi:MAG: hypothetical protein AAF633_02970 [Chloroflexota bacterium]